MCTTASAACTEGVASLAMAPAARNTPAGLGEADGEADSANAGVGRRGFRSRTERLASPAKQGQPGSKPGEEEGTLGHAGFIPPRMKSVGTGEPRGEAGASALGPAAWVSGD